MKQTRLMPGVSVSRWWKSNWVRVKKFGTALVTLRETFQERVGATDDEPMRRPGLDHPDDAPDDR
ncbi:MAG: hypothetical protein MUE39_10175, partial [Gammaproteobacteria bacterium]|nr:hypothetical protein [Gammaproteobacteria bacterium]